jgi:hypothetical protein
VLWRHASIAISRLHLPEGYKFKRDYGPHEEILATNLQAAHSSRVAGACYARDVREGHGHVASLRAEFCTSSRNCHTCLGFGVPLLPRDESVKLLNDGSTPEADPVALHRASAGELAGHKRTREELEIKLNDWLRLESVMQTKKKRVGRGTRAVKVCLIE